MWAIDLPQRGHNLEEISNAYLTAQGAQRRTTPLGLPSLFLVETSVCCVTQEFIFTSSKTAAKAVHAWARASSSALDMSTPEKTSNSDGTPADHDLPHEHLHPEPVDGGVVLASVADADLLASMGYKQELKRNFSTLEVFGIAFSIMGLLPSISSTLTFSLPAGPAGMVWSWFLASGCIFLVGLAMADLGSAMPTSGGLYYWTHYFASPKTRNYLCFLVGYSNTLSLVGGFCSINCLSISHLHQMTSILNRGLQMASP